MVCVDRSGLQRAAAGGCVTGGASPPTLLDWSFDCHVPFWFDADASPERFVFDCSTSPDRSACATQTGTYTLTGAIWIAFDSAVAVCDVLFEFDASCDCVDVAAVVASPLVASPEPQQPPPPVVASPVDGVTAVALLGLLVRLAGLVHVPGRRVARAVRVRLLTPPESQR